MGVLIMPLFFFLTSFASMLLQTATPVPTMVPIDIADVTTEVTGAMFSVVPAATLAILGGAAFVLMLARRFGPGLIKSLK